MVLGAVLYSSFSPSKTIFCSLIITSSSFSFFNCSNSFLVSCILFSNSSFVLTFVIHPSYKVCFRFNAFNKSSTNCWVIFFCLTLITDIFLTLGMSTLASISTFTLNFSFFIFFLYSLYSRAMLSGFESLSPVSFACCIILSKFLFFTTDSSGAF